MRDWWPWATSRERVAVTSDRRELVRPAEAAPELVSQLPEQAPALPIYHDGSLW